jgi:hypothetical protein
MAERGVENGPSRAAVILIALWAVSVFVFGASDVFHDASFGPGVGVALGLGFLAVMAFVAGLNLLLPALVLGIVGIGRSDPGSRVLRAGCLALTLIGGVVGSFALSGWTTGADDSQNVGAGASHLGLRGLGMWLVAAVAALASARLLRTRLLSQALAPRTRAVAAGLAGCALGALFLWMHQTARPSVTVTNDSSRMLAVQFCPHQDCTGRIEHVKPHKDMPIVFGTAGDPNTPDELRVLSGGDLVGCILVERDPRLPPHLRLMLSEADPTTC